MFEHTSKSGNRELLPQEEYHCEVGFISLFITWAGIPATQLRKRLKIKWNVIEIFFFFLESFEDKKVETKYVSLSLYILVGMFARVDRKRQKEKEWGGVDNITLSLVYFEEDKAGFW